MNDFLDAAWALRWQLALLYGGIVLGLLYEGWVTRRG